MTKQNLYTAFLSVSTCLKLEYVLGVVWQVKCSCEKGKKESKEGKKEKMEGSERVVFNYIHKQE